MVGRWPAQSGYRLSHGQVLLLVGIVSLCMTAFNFPALHAQMGRAIWVAFLLQGLISLLGGLGAARIVALAGSRTLVDVAASAVGRPLARLFVILVAVYFVAWGPIADAPVAAQLVRSAVTPLSPVALFVVPLVFAGLYAAAYGPEVIARVVEVWAWLIVPALAAVVVVPLMMARWMYLWPAWEPKGIALGPDVWAYALGLRGFVVALALCGYIRRPAQAPRPVLWGVALGWLATSLMFLQPNALFPPSSLAQLAIPELASMDSVNAEPVAVHSFVALSVPLWFAIAFVVTATTAWAGSELLRQGLGLRTRHWTLGATTAIQLSGGWGPWASSLPALTTDWSFFGYAVVLVAPWLIWATLAATRRRTAAA